MTDQSILNRVSALEKTVQGADDRTRRLGEKVGTLKDSVQTDLVPKVAKVEVRVDMLVWIFGIMLSFYTALFIAGGIQLYLLNGRVAGIESDIHHISAAVDGVRLKQVSANPTDPLNSAEAQIILKDARSRNIKIPQKEVNDAAARFLEVSSSNPEAWKATVAFVDYKSFLNTANNPSPGPLKAPLNAEYTIENPTKETLNFGLAGRLVPPEHMPQFRLLSSSSPNPRNGRGLIPEYIKVTGGVLALDGFYMKQIVLDSVHVIYRGGPVELENVYFINCTFEFAPEPQRPHLDFAKTLLGSPSVTFNAG